MIVVIVIIFGDGTDDDSFVHETNEPIKMAIANILRKLLDMVLLLNITIIYARALNSTCRDRATKYTLIQYLDSCYHWGFITFAC